MKGHKIAPKCMNEKAEHLMRKRGGEDQNKGGRGGQQRHRRGPKTAAQVAVPGRSDA